MTRAEVLADVRQTLGTVPEWITNVPDHVLEHEWSILKNFQLGETKIPNKYKELIGLGVAATLECPYCINFHKEAAKFWGATDEEVTESLLMAKLTAGWSTYISGTEYSLDKFKKETAAIIEHVKNQPKSKMAGK